ncbi:thiolase family protein [Homoserinibacter gongjuensis]|uniref:Probable acetyl-CoA acetyltransferase n=1 Tax=Homoserinibacter gongjuensis TaxID=1162968 RepID=A0ABQ6JRN8_9MICO|nr:thiolase family protein [Homoserinibacter gongjuensis]GMA90971.1 acetyl-CoA acyltransferase [Homoserinibacter gongjuensis]
MHSFVVDAVRTPSGVTVNRLCGSSVEAVVQGSRAIESGDARIVLAGGVESMSRAPYVVEKPARAWPASGNPTMWNTAIGWRMTHPSLPGRWTASNGEVTERLARLHGIPREEQDVFALRSHELAAAAWADGVFADEIVQVAGVELARDEGIRDDTSLERLAALPRCSPRTAASRRATRRPSTMVPPRSCWRRKRPSMRSPSRIAGRGVVGNDPELFGVAPVVAAERALARAGRSWADVDLVELNEAFAAQALACLRLWPELDPAIVNVHGGAIAIGHPLGASGGRLVARAAHELRRRGGGVAVVAICVGVGQGLAIVLER